jgi:lysyl-tRNA synthetase, class II
MNEHHHEESQIRKNKIEQLQQFGVAPWPEAEVVTATLLTVKEAFKEGLEQGYEVAGRVMTMRWHGKSAFFTLQDRSGQLQIYCKQDLLGDEKFKFLEQFIDIGDYLWCKGSSFTTKTGEITLKAIDIRLLAKCLHPLPEKFHGIADVELRYRQRYLDLISNQESREKFIKRSLIVRTIRSFLDQNEFFEVETPMLHPIAGGAAARPFVTHHNALASDFYLRIAPELYLKRLVVGGFERVYEINRNFRNEGISTRHNPEFTMLELYLAHHNYQYMMDFSQRMICHVVKTVCGALQVSFGIHSIDFGKPFERISVYDSVIKYGNITEDALSPDAIDMTLKQNNVKVHTSNPSYMEKVYLLFEALVEHQLVQPTFITEFPIEVSPLAKRDAVNPSIAARFELFIAGMELANAFNELNDPFDQAERFRHQLELHKQGNDEAHQYDADYVQALEYGLPPTVGFGMGIDRLTMLLTDTTSIKDVILFPTLKKK